MTPDRWRSVKEVFTAASALPDAERSAFLNEACAGDAELLAEVESLLAAHDEEVAIIDRPAAAHAASELLCDSTDPWIGRRIGSYEIVSLIGRGGMSEVYRARRVDAQYEKEVAIKLVPGGFSASYVLQRFRAERQILANLDHPNIARLIDGGATEDGSPYLVMELVEGQALDAYATVRSLPVRERLRLFRDVCAAVSYAHQRLVVHRDLKPSNIQVTADGTVKLLDFGIAKLLQPAMPEAGATPTMTVMRALTPGFSSPEQMLGKPISTASDVYSLGVVLYVLLTGQSPYRSALDTAEDAIRQVCDTEPVRPSIAVRAGTGAARGSISRDLDAIILRALRKEPDKRYASVEQFSEDIRRYLAGLPVHARGDQFSYRAGKFLRRHRIEMAAAAVVALTLIGSTVIALREARIATSQERIAEGERERAERHFASVRKLANTFMFRVHDAIEELPGSTEARELLVTTALEYLNTLSAEAGMDRELQLELAAAYEKVGDIQGQAFDRSKGNPRAAFESYSRAISLLERIVAADASNRAALRSLAGVSMRQSRLLLTFGETRKAIAASKRAISILEPLSSAHTDVESRKALSAAHAAHAQNLMFGGATPSERMLHSRRSVAMLEDLVRQHPDDHELASDLSVAYGILADAVLGPDPVPGALDDNLAYNRKALAIDERLVAVTAGRNATYIRYQYADLHNIAIALFAKGDFRGALENLRAARKVLARLADDPNDSQARIDDANSAWHLARILLALGEVGEAAKLFERNLATLRKLGLEEDNLQVMYVLAATEYGLGSVHSRLASTPGSAGAMRLEHWRLAKDWYGKAIPRFERVTSSVTLNFMDMRPVTDAIAGLARSEAEIGKLTAVAAEG